MSALEKFLRDLVKELVIDAVEMAVDRLREPKQSLIDTPAANDDNAAASDTGSQAPNLDYETLKGECLAIINQLAPDHGPQIRAMFAEFGIKRLSEAGDQLLPAIFERLKGLKDAK